MTGPKNDDVIANKARSIARSKGELQKNGRYRYEDDVFIINFDPKTEHVRVKTKPSEMGPGTEWNVFEQGYDRDDSYGRKSGHKEDTLSDTHPGWVERLRKIESDD